MRRFTLACVGIALLLAAGGVLVQRSHGPVTRATPAETQQPPPLPLPKRAAAAGPVGYSAAGIVPTVRVSRTTPATP